MYQLIVDAYYAVGDRLAAERMALATDPLVRLQMAGINPEVASNWQFATFKRFLPSVPGPCTISHIDPVLHFYLIWILESLF